MMSRRFRHFATVAALALAFSVSASCARQSAALNVCPPAAAAPAVANLADLQERAGASGTVRVIVRLAGLEGVQPAMADMQGAAMETFESAGVGMVEPLGARLPYVVAEVTAAQLGALYANPQFADWSEDRVAFPTLAESGPLVQAPQLWDLGGRGAGQGVAILDTGVDASHPFLAGRVVSEACFSTTSALNGSSSVCPNGQSQQIGAGAAQPCSAAGCEHGTHVAGIAAGRGSDFSGMAPDADIVAVQVFSVFRGAACGGGGAQCIASFTSDQIRALDFVLQQAGSRAIAAANMSLGGGRATAACDSDLTKSVIDQLRAAGVATVIASGNDGFRDAVSFPGCISSAVTVGATSKQDELASFSNCGPQTDLHAPGVGIVSSLPGNRFAALSGTSMATPHVAGAFAVLRSRHTGATVSQIEAALGSGGVDVGGRPRIRLLEADTALGAAAPAEAAMAEPTNLQGAVGELAALPDDQPVRIIVGVRDAAALPAAETAARQAGASYVGRMGGQPLLVIEATPAQARALAHSGAITSMQVDTVARTQN